MTAAKVIDAIKRLPPSEQAEVIQFAFELARSRPLTGQELRELADRLAESNDPGEIIRLKSAMTRGFYGTDYRYSACVPMSTVQTVSPSRKNTTRKSASMMAEWTVFPYRADKE